MSEQVGAGGSAVTVIVTVQMAVPPAPLALPVYVVVTDGVTEVDPLETGVTAPTPWSTLNDVALAVSHDIVDAFPS